MNNVSKLGTTFSKFTGRSGLILKKYSPEILLVVGIGGIVVSGVLACRATLKAEAILDDHKDKMVKIKDAKNLVFNSLEEGLSTDGQQKIAETELYSDADYKKDLAIVYTQTCVNFVKLYGPAVTLALGSIVCIVASHGIIKQRNIAMVAAYKAVEEGFNKYRQRVRDEFGDDKDYAYKNGLAEETVTEIVTDEEGKKTKVKKTKLIPGDPNDISMYARFFDETNPEWRKDPEINLFFVKAQQNTANELLKMRGHIFLNEVYDMLGFERTKAGAVVGWTISKDGGDNYVDFGIFNGENPRARAFVNGNERSILLDFNVDGIIYDKI